MGKPRQWTDQEVREKFLARVLRLISYWEDETRAPTSREKLEGLAFSILVVLDGGSGGSPGFVLAPRPAKEDEAYHKAQGKNWYPRAEHEHDIAGSLHERFSALTKKPRS